MTIVNEPPATPRRDEDAAGERGRGTREAAGGKVDECRSRVEERAAAADETRRRSVGDGAGERLAEAPQEVLEGDGEGERLAVETAQLGQRVGEEAEARADAERDDRDEAARR